MFDRDFSNPVAPRGASFDGHPGFEKQPGPRRTFSITAGNFGTKDKVFTEGITSHDAEDRSGMNLTAVGVGSFYQNSEPYTAKVEVG